MKTSGFIAFLALLLALSLWLAPRAQAIVMVKNYTRYLSPPAELPEYLKSRPDDTPRYTGWRAILNLFR